MNDTFDKKSTFGKARILSLSSRAISKMNIKNYSKVTLSLKISNLISFLCFGPTIEKLFQTSCLKCFGKKMIFLPIAPLSNL